MAVKHQVDIAGIVNFSYSEEIPHLKQMLTDNVESCNFCYYQEYPISSTKVLEKASGVLGKLKAPLRSMYWTLKSDIFEELVRHMIFSDCTNIAFLSGLSYSCSSLLKYNLPYMTKKVGL